MKFNFYYLDQVVGNLISSLVLKREKLPATNLTLDYNFTNETIELKKDFSYCGVNGCPNIKSGEATLPPNIITVKETWKNFINLYFKFFFSKVYVMCGIYIAFGLTAVFISSIFLDNYKPKKKGMLSILTLK